MSTGASGPHVDLERWRFSRKQGRRCGPGQQPPVDFIGKSTKNISANDLIWEFFEKHPMK
ncbi:MAG: hypothetical protein WCJ35_05370 [Planctomycetota bacterium]